MQSQHGGLVGLQVEHRDAASLVWHQSLDVLQG